MPLLRPPREKKGFQSKIHSGQFCIRKSLISLRQKMQCSSKNVFLFWGLVYALALLKVKRWALAVAHWMGTTPKIFCLINLTVCLFYDSQLSKNQVDDLTGYSLDLVGSIWTLTMLFRAKFWFQDICTRQNRIVSTTVGFTPFFLYTILQFFEFFS